MSEGRDLRAEPTEEQAEALMVQMGFTSISQEDIAILSSALAQAREAGRREEREANIAAIRAACEPCGGAGGTVTEGTAYGHDCGGDDRLCASRCPVPEQVQDFTECEYCGRPIAAIERGGHLRRGE